MPHERRLATRRLRALWERTDTPCLPLDGRFVVVSDLHMGDGGWADDFRRNEDLLAVALVHYHREGFSLILLGDIEELWQFRPEAPLARYQRLYDLIRSFGRHRVVRVFGNHDECWRHCPDPLWEDRSPCPEAVKLCDQDAIPRVLLVHGHQGSIESDRLASLSRPLVRVFRFVEPLARRLGLYRNPATAFSPIARDFEKVMHGWAKDSGVVLVCGHSHRAVFASVSYAERLRRRLEALTGREVKEEVEDLRQELRREVHQGRDMEPPDGPEPVPCYFNCGCGLYRDGITALELDQGAIRLVKWQRGTLRRVIYQEGSLAEFVAQTLASSGSPWD